MHLDSPILLLLVQIGLVLAASRVVGWLFSKLHQPQVMGEMIAGILLGPSLLGLVAPQLSAAIFPPASIPVLGILSKLGVILFLFLIGLELDPKLIKNRGHAAVFISHASILGPFLLGALLALFLYTRLFNDTPLMRFAAVALFMGAAMSITAFPVLARILTERNLHQTRVGAVTITCAAVDDVTAWCLLAFVVAVAKTNGVQPALITAGLATAYVLVMFFAIRPLTARLQLYYDRTGRLTQNLVAITLLLVMASAFTTELIGIHALFGAFLMGAIMPKGGKFVRELSEKLEDFTVVFLLPIFFAFTGLKTQIGLLDSWELWGYTLLIIAVACLGKFGGSTLAARLSGFTWRESSAIGILMNTRGLMELLILNIGRELGVITDAVFAMMVIMAIVTTAMTTPILHWVYPRRLFAEGEEPPAAKPSVFSVMIPIAHPRSGAPLLQLADAIAGHDRNQMIYALHLRRPVDHEAYRVGIDPVPDADDQESLQPLLAQADKLSVHVEPITFVSRDVPGDIARVADHRKVDLVLMGFHKPVIGATILGGTVHRVLTQTPTNVAIFVDRGYRGAKQILVAYLGGPHDTLALEIARRLARSPDVFVTVVHVASPQRNAERSAAEVVDRYFSEPGLANQVHFKVIQSEQPVDVVVQHAREADLTIIAVAEEWGLESHLFGFRSERLAQEVESSLLIVRRHHALPLPIDAPTQQQVRV